ncbi:MAG: hypothetical protein LH491_07110 [Pseudoxanthomonas sp.]|nr:hypothetical protein [Pseudoxanthomonas sp.]
MSPESMLAKSRQQATQAARDAASRSPAYRVLLAEAGIDVAQLARLRDPAQLPLLTKANTFARFSLEQLAGSLQPRELADVLTSSGNGGDTFGFSLATRRSHDRSWYGIDLGLQDAFDVDGRSTLLVNCLPMGVVFKSRAVTVANVSVREDMACAILREVGPSFEQCIVCTDPLFVNRLLDHAQTAGVDWTALSASLILGEEVLVEAQREYIAARTGIDLDRDPRRLVGSSFGVGELGLNLLFETRESIRLQRALALAPLGAAWLCRPVSQCAMPVLFCFNPMRCHVEIVEPDAHGFGALCITMLDNQAVIALPRYLTGDVARLISPAEAAQACTAAGLQAPWLPMLALRGRSRDHSRSPLAVEDIKQAIYCDHELARALTGAFSLGQRADGVLHLQLQARPGLDPVPHDLTAGLARRLAPAGQRLEIAILPAGEFAHHSVQDYERKFRYLDETLSAHPASYSAG